MTNLQELSAAIAKAIAEGQRAAAAQENDGGSANLDHVVLTGLRGVRQSSLEKAGIPIAWKDCSIAGAFHLRAPFGGQGQRNYAGVQAMADSLKRDGVSCYVHYQMD